MASEPVLITPEINAPFIVRTDASDHGIGAILLQNCNKLLLPGRFSSRKLLRRECNYSTTERETLAIVFAVSTFFFYKFLAFKHFVLQTDHKPLIYLKQGKVKNSGLIRWALCFQGFSFSIVHIPGGHNFHRDALSRSV